MNYGQRLIDDARGGRPLSGWNSWSTSIREARTPTGAIVALWLPEDVAAQLAIAGGEPPEDLHITLAFLGGDTAAMDFTEEQVAAAVEAVAASAPELSGVISGFGRFTVENGDEAVWATVDLVGLDQLRVDLVAALEAAGIATDGSHGFTPHVTLTYVPAGEPTPVESVGPVDVSFSELTVAWAGTRTTYPLGGEPMKKTTEAFPGDRTYGEVRTLLANALGERLGGEKTWIWVRDLSDTTCIYEVESGGECCLYQVDFSLDDAGVITFGTPVEVEARTVYEPAPPEGNPLADAEIITEAIAGRVREDKGTDASGGRIFRVDILQFGVSRNGVSYTQPVMEAAAALYEGAKAFDHHRTTGELQTSTIEGLVGGFRNVEATATALEADLYLLPSATHTVEALELSLEAQAQGLPPLVGFSHDVALTQREAVIDGRKVREATAIRQVFSVDVVADPSAGGRVTRTVAGGFGDINKLQEEPMKTLAEMWAEATDEDKAAFRRALEATPAHGSNPADTVRTYEASQVSGKMLIEAAVADAQLGTGLVDVVAGQLGERFTEADLTAVIESVVHLAEKFEVAGLKPHTPHVEVTKEAIDKKAEKLLATFEGRYTEGYKSIKQAYADISGVTSMDLLDADLAYAIMREAAAHAPVEGRQRESIDSGTFGAILADTLHRRLLQVYGNNDLQAWRDLVSDIVPRMDFRTNHVTRMGGYGTLPDVAEGDPYVALDSPGDEEATYAVAKKGGTEDLTLETIANDDIRALARIPIALGRAAALTLYKFVVDGLFSSNPTIYDTVALFATGHTNTAATAALSQETLTARRAAMRKQAQLGVSDDVLSIVPKFLWVPTDLEETAYKLCTSAVVLTSTSDATIPNIHQGLIPRVVDHWSDTNDWFLSADPVSVPTIELGFYNGQTDPELFVQDDPRTGAVFTNDKITYKIRHIYGGTVLDYRGFQRGQG